MLQSYPVCFTLVMSSLIILKFRKKNQCISVDSFVHRVRIEKNIYICLYFLNRYIKLKGDIIYMVNLFVLIVLKRFIFIDICFDKKVLNL